MAREQALKAGNKTEATEPLARLEAGIREVQQMATELKGKIGNPADK
ncbi:MAG TPA: hypothetical protein PK765_01475 [bacterium]|nr:hypothetical protein [bacterium]